MMFLYHIHWYSLKKLYICWVPCHITFSMNLLTQWLISLCINFCKVTIYLVYEEIFAVIPRLADPHASCLTALCHAYVCMRISYIQCVHMSLFYGRRHELDLPGKQVGPCQTQENGACRMKHDRQHTSDYRSACTRTTAAAYEWHIKAQKRTRTSWSFCEGEIPTGCRRTQLWRYTNCICMYRIHTVTIGSRALILGLFDGTHSSMMAKWQQHQEFMARHVRELSLILLHP
jgi:hypothetical protein